MSKKNNRKECDICGEYLNKSKQRPIKCSYDECGSECCVICFNRYLTESTLNPKCMFCHKDVSMDFIWEVSTQKFYDQYIEYRTLIIMVRQKSLIPTSQHLAEQILKETLCKKNWVNYSSTNPLELVILSKREDPAHGTHSIKYSSIIDDIEITHTAHSRHGFAQGAVLAAEYLAGKTGIFSMKDVLGLY